ncbi:apicoplast dimethyladenosine synthase, putative [Plasmodium gallinaceum]|uniref:rRNA adenine N(6)-methyltransferase n=1 Tax=Plasmodium gallinaceum TaxID=5849 RepID=A0A1J1GXC2_PLAGA|nr:apicoplast dimethyladenosine synthase, putative [Plasmodium gallinaceum]CRG97127.1 apicoplast dimethyladenosine synthase, putative [Plasmodium gallinaceum]
MNKTLTKFIYMFLLLLFVKIKCHFLKEINNVALLDSKYFYIKLRRRNNRNVLHFCFIENNIKRNIKKKKICKKKLILLSDYVTNEDGKSYNESTKNKYISQTFEGISIYPLKQEDKENPLRTKIPANEFKPKRSLGQNYLKDENIIRKMVDAVELDINDYFFFKNSKVNVEKKNEQNCKKEKNENEKNSECESFEKHNFESIKNKGKGIIELGCGLGQISKFLFRKYPNMTGIEIDSRALSIISRTMPGFDFIHDDVLQVNYRELSLNKKTKLTVIGNLPFYITSQILFCLLDFYKYIEQAIVTIQYEVGQRIVAKPNNKNYSILSILFSLYSKPYLLFKIPSKAFYPVPKVEAAVMKIIFKKEDFNCNLLFLKQILRYAFQQRRKKLKSSLKPLLNQYNINQIPQSFIDLRPQQLLPCQFIELTNILFPLNIYPFDQNIQTKVWRKKKHGE